MRRATTVGAAVLSVLAVLGLLLLVTQRDRGIPFDRHLWAGSTGLVESVRFAMAKHLISHHTLRGKSRAEVLALLGEPAPPNTIEGWDLVYFLGADRDSFMPIDPAWLAIRFDQQGTVERYQLIRG